MGNEKLFYEANNPGLHPEEVEFYERSFQAEGEPHVIDPIKRAYVATTIFIASEVMYFGALISAFFRIKRTFIEWPPEGLPTYPVIQTLFNTLFLLASGVFNLVFDKRRKKIFFVLTWVFGATFLILQGIEWIRLIKFGLTMTTHAYGSIFYLIVGSHGIHVLVGLIWLLIAFNLSQKRGVMRTPALESASLLWKFVVLIWPVLYLVVYIL
jgi:heme/copper-type cytochrome/quinol oxidase subunit 3